jgi:hypothetical protein
VRTRIEGAALVIADLTCANAKNRAEDVKFDLRGQRYLEYKSIQDLQTRLTLELRGLSELSLAR